MPLGPGNSQTELEASEEENNALFTATTCEEQPFPWQRARAPATRRAEALAALHALPSSDFYPFAAETAWQNSLDRRMPELARPAPPHRPPIGHAAERADADPLRRAGPAHADRQRARRRGEDPGRAAARRPLHRALGDRQRLQRLRRAGRRRRSSRAPRCSRARRRAIPSARPRSPRPGSPTCSPCRASPASPAARSPRCSTRSSTSSARSSARRCRPSSELPSGSSFGGLHGGYARLSKIGGASRRLHLRPRASSSAERCRRPAASFTPSTSASRGSDRGRTAPSCSPPAPARGGDARRQALRPQHRQGAALARPDDPAARRAPLGARRTPAAGARPPAVSASAHGAERCRPDRAPAAGVRLSACPTRSRRRPLPTCASTPRTPSTGCPGDRPRWLAHASATCRCWSRSATPRATGAT